jgi:hypothetical protein
MDFTVLIVCVRKTSSCQWQVMISDHCYGAGSAYQQSSIFGYLHWYKVEITKSKKMIAEKGKCVQNQGTMLVNNFIEVVHSSLATSDNERLVVVAVVKLTCCPSRSWSSQRACHRRTYITTSVTFILQGSGTVQRSSSLSTLWQTCHLAWA